MLLEPMRRCTWRRRVALQPKLLRAITTTARTGLGQRGQDGDLSTHVQDCPDRGAELIGAQDCS
jgi:hypothetical protein